MTKTDRPTEDDSDSEVREIRQTFRTYRTSGRSSRWEGRELGARLATAERDRWLIHAAGAHASGTVVDLGCGDGNVGLTLSGAGRIPARYIGVDILAERLSIAAQRVPWGEFLLASATDVPLPDAAADLVVACVMFSSLMEATARARVCAEIDRLLKPGGKVLIYDLRYPSPGNRRVRPFGAHEIRRSFPGWAGKATTLTLVPPIARSPLVGSDTAYRLLAGLPLLRSHVGVALTKPA